MAALPPRESYTHSHTHRTRKPPAPRHPRDDPDAIWLTEAAQAVTLFAYSSPFFIYDGAIYSAAALARTLRRVMDTLPGEPLDCVLDLLAMDAKDDVLVRTVLLRKKLERGELAPPPERDEEEVGLLCDIAGDVCEGAVMRNVIGGGVEGYLTCVLWLLLTAAGAVENVTLSQALDAMARCMKDHALVENLGLPPAIALPHHAFVLGTEWNPVPFASSLVAETLLRRVPLGEWPADEPPHFILAANIPNSDRPALFAACQPFFALSCGSVCTLEQGVDMVTSAISPPANSAMRWALRLVRRCGHGEGMTTEDRFEAFALEAVMAAAQSEQAMCLAPFAVDPGVAHFAVKVLRSLVCDKPLTQLGPALPKSAILCHRAHYLVLLLRMFAEETCGFKLDPRDRETLTAPLDIVVQPADQTNSAKIVKSIAARVAVDVNWCPVFEGGVPVNILHELSENNVFFVRERLTWLNARSADVMKWTLSLASVPKLPESSDRESPQKPL